MEITQFIEETLRSLFESSPFDDCFLVDIVESGGRKITVYFDSDSGVTLEKCTRVSRYLEEQLDARSYQGGEYILDVSSPGIDRPLIFWRQYPRQKGRDLLVVKKDGSKVEGTLSEVGMETISIQTDKQTTTEIPFSEIEESFVQIRF